MSICIQVPGSPKVRVGRCGHTWQWPTAVLCSHIWLFCTCWFITYIQIFL